MGTVMMTRGRIVTSWAFVCALGACAHRVPHHSQEADYTVVSSGRIVWLAADDDDVAPATAEQSTPAVVDAPQRGQVDDTSAEDRAAAVALARFVLARDVADREPVGEDATFEPGERVYAFLQFRNPDRPYRVRVRWERTEEEGSSSKPIPVTVGTSVRWRTWSWTRLPEKPGRYRCVVETPEGEELSVRPFLVADRS